MKKIYKNIALAFAAALLLAPVASAQTTVPYHLDTGYGVGYNKYLKSTVPNENGEYTLRIETFATGEVDAKDIPSDIVLVLDNSGSMLYDYNAPGASYSNVISGSVGDDLLIQDNNPDMKFYYSYNYLDFGITDAGIGTSSSWRGNAGWAPSFNNCKRYVKYSDGNYYRLQRGGNSTAGYYLYISVNGTPKYLTDDGLVDTAPTNVTNARGIIYSGTDLYRPQTRVEKLLESVHAFIDEIAKKSDDMELENGKTGNQVAIVSFGYPTIKTGVTSPSPYTFVVSDFVPVSKKDGSVTTLNEKLKNMNFWGDTAIGYGMQLGCEALTDLQTGNPAMNPFVMNDDGTTYRRTSAGNLITNRSKVLVLFTDGAPTGEGDYGGFSGDKATRARAIAYSNTVKETGEGKINGKIFTVGLNAGGNASFLQHLSSNYPSSGYNGSFTPPTSSSSLYYADAGLVNLSTVFETIASLTGGSAEISGTSLLNIDLISDSFQLPENANESSIKVYTAQCLGITGETITDGEGNTHNVLAFAEPVLAKGRAPVASLWISRQMTDEQGNPMEGQFEWTELVDEDIDEGLSWTVDKTANTVSVTGFNYADYWCGLDPKHTNTEQYTDSDPNYGYHKDGYRGFKLIFDIPIVVKDGALGGSSVPTNKDGSGLKDPVTEKVLIEYPKPSLPIPVNLWIEKRGLNPGESATFTILRKLIVTDPSTVEAVPVYHTFTRVNVTGSADGTPVVAKLLNLDPSYYYKIWEEGWSWSYTNQAQDQDTAPSTEDPSLTNPIVIENTYDDPDIKHAEAIKENLMRKTE